MCLTSLSRAKAQAFDAAPSPSSRPQRPRFQLWPCDAFDLHPLHLNRLARLPPLPPPVGAQAFCPGPSPLTPPPCMAAGLPWSAADDSGSCGRACYLLPPPPTVSSCRKILNTCDLLLCGRMCQAMQCAVCGVECVGQPSPLSSSPLQSRPGSALSVIGPGAARSAEPSEPLLTAHPLYSGSREA